MNEGRMADEIANLQRRVAALEASRDQQAAQQQATCGNSRGPLKTFVGGGDAGFGQSAKPGYAPGGSANLYAPLRSDTKPLIDLAAFARRLLNPDDLGHAVTKEVRDCARRALGMPEVREYDL